MCDPITIAGIALSAGSVVANTVGAQQDTEARSKVIAGQRAQQLGLNAEADAVNKTSQDRYLDFGGQQSADAKKLGDLLNTPAPANSTVTPGTQLPTSSNDAVNAEIAKQMAKASAFNTQQGTALGNKDSFGDVLGNISRLQGRDAQQVGQIEGFKTGDANVEPYQLDAASHAGDGAQLLGDILGGAGSITTGIGRSGGLNGMFATAPTPATMSSAIAASRAATPATY